DQWWTARVVCFFQAEDGIRGATVTGVQTCALPISLFTTMSRTTTSMSMTGSQSKILNLSKFLRTYSKKAHIARTWTATQMARAEIGRASCRERVESWEA